MKFSSMMKCVSTVSVLFSFVLFSQYTQAAPKLPKTLRDPVFLAVYSDVSPNTNMFTEWQNKGQTSELSVCQRVEDGIVNVPTLENPFQANQIDQSNQTNQSKAESGFAGRYQLGKLLVPVLSLTSLIYEFARAGEGGSIDSTQSGSFLQYYDSLLVLGGDNFLADGLTSSLSVLLEKYGINAVHARGASAILMLVPAEWGALVRKDPVLNMKRLTFSQAANHFAFKSFSNQVAAYVTELTVTYLSDNLLKDAHPAVRLMVGKTVSAGVIATPWLFNVVVDSVRYGGQREKKIYFDSGADFLFSTSVTAVQSVTQMGIHHFLDGHKDPHSNEGVNRKVDEGQVNSQLITAGIFVGSWAVLDKAANCLPMPAPLKVITKQVAKHSLKVSAYAVNGAIKKGSYHALQSRVASNLITLLSSITMSKLAYMATPVAPGDGFDAAALGALQNGFGISSMSALFELAVDLPALALEIAIDNALSYGEALAVSMIFREGWQ